MVTKNKVGTFANEWPHLGSCCACRLFKPDVRHIVCLPFKAPVPGTGWGCVQCGIPMDGATAVLCDDCVQMEEPLQEICYGLPAEMQRVPIAEYADGEAHEHRLERHPEFAPYN